jgi:hypothetical protein
MGEDGADPLEEEDGMTPLYEDAWFNFGFSEDRIIHRFHLESVPVGRQVSVNRIDPGTGERLGRPATEIVGDGDGVDLTEPIMVQAGEAFIAKPESTT